MDQIYQIPSHNIWQNNNDAFNFTGGDYLAALAGNPNTGKSTVFNALTGLKQHTGNWPGKTVMQAYGNFRHEDKMITLVDLPGTYSLLTNSPEEEVARNFICFGRPDVTIVVVDATCLERNLNFVLQVLEVAPKTVVCLNLIDEARRKKIQIDHLKLQEKLGVPVVPTSARYGEGLDKLKNTAAWVAAGRIKVNPMQVRYDESIENAIEKLASRLASIFQNNIDKRWVALRLMEGNGAVISSIQNYLKSRQGRN